MSPIDPGKSYPYLLHTAKGDHSSDTSNSVKTLIQTNLKKFLFPFFYNEVELLDCSSFASIFASAFKIV